MKYPLIALPLSTLLVLTGCGGSGSGGDDEQVKTAPTVTVTAPAKAAVSTAFTVQWSSTDATSCKPDFSAKVTASGEESITEDEEGPQTYSVTCTGEGGSATGSASVSIEPLATPEGRWQGSSTGNGGSRTVSGIVTKENNFWVVYNGVDATAGEPAGFFAGSASTSEQTLTGGKFATPTALLEFNFAGVNPGVGSLNATYTGKAKFDGTTLASLPSLRGSQAYTIDGVTDPVSSGGLGAILTQVPEPVTFSDGGTPWTILPNANDPGAPAALAGKIVFAPYQALVDMTATGLGNVNLNVPSRQLEITGGTPVWDAGTRTLTVTGITFVETSPNVTCDDFGTGFCVSVPGPADATHGDITITFAPDMINYQGVANAYQGIAILAVDSTGICIAEGGANPCANNTLTFSGAISNGTPATTTQTLTTTYDATYEATPDVATLAGTYTGNAGVDTALEPASTFTVAANGDVTGATTNCVVAGKVAPHSSGNVYDVTQLSFTGSSCTLVSKAFTGIATLDAATNTITVTAITANGDTGFLFVGAKP